MLRSSSLAALAALALSAAAGLAACTDAIAPTSSGAPTAPRFGSGQKTGQCFLQSGVSATQVAPQSGGGGATTLTAPAGDVVTQVAIKAGTACWFTPSGATGTYTVSSGGSPCYVVAGLGTAIVTVSRVGGGSSCKDISGIEYVTAPAPTTGSLVICTELPIAPTASYTFAFDVGTTPPLTVGIVTPVGQGRTCAGPVALPAGPVSVTEQYAAGFEPFGIVSEGVGALLSSDLTTRTATVEIVSGATATVVFQNSIAEQET